MRILRYVLFFLVAVVFTDAHAQEKKAVTYVLAVEPINAWLWAHDKGVSEFAGTTGMGFQMDLKRYRTDAVAFDYAKRHFSSGYMLQFIQFNNSSAGYALNLSYFIEPFLFERKKYSLRIRTAGGANYASNPYDSLKNPDNSAYSTRINGYLGLGLHFNYKATEKTSVFVNATFSHFSNGNTNNPNYGVNFPNVGAGFEYVLKSSVRPQKPMLFYNEKWRFDIISFGCNKSLPVTRTKRYWAYGAELKASRQVSRLHAWTFGMEGYVDESMRVAMDNHPVYFDKHYSNYLFALLGGHEYLLNRCIFSQQLGVYLFKEIPGDHINRVYHRWGFNYKLTRNWMLGMSLNANLQKAFIFDGRLVYSFYR